MITPDLLQRLCRARERLQTELESPPTVAAVARDAGLSTAHFITQFKGLFGVTPLQCRTRARIVQARAALAGTGESATQVSLALGFAHPGSFSRVFARHVGSAPQDWRRGAPAEAPAGCVDLMNLALAGHRNFGEADAAASRHDRHLHSDQAPPCASS